MVKLRIKPTKKWLQQHTISAIRFKIVSPNSAKKVAMLLKRNSTKFRIARRICSISFRTKLMSYLTLPKRLSTKFKTRCAAFDRGHS